jgi:hypothetical protein
MKYSGNSAESASSPSATTRIHRCGALCRRFQSWRSARRAVRRSCAEVGGV